jgi:hypothetical protein
MLVQRWECEELVQLPSIVFLYTRSSRTSCSVLLAQGVPILTDHHSYPTLAMCSRDDATENPLALPLRTWEGHAIECCVGGEQYYHVYPSYARPLRGFQGAANNLLKLSLLLPSREGSSSFTQRFTAGTSRLVTPQHLDVCPLCTLDLYFNTDCKLLLFLSSISRNDGVHSPRTKQWWH